MPIILFFLFAFLLIYIEISLVIWLGSHIGALGVILLLILTALVGISMIRSRGLYTIVKVRQQLAVGEIPTRSLLQSGIWLVAGILLLIPGFLSDILAILLLLPPVRLFIEAFIAKKIIHFSASIWQKTRSGFYTYRQGKTTDQEDIIDAEFETEVDDQHRLK